MCIRDRHSVLECAKIETNNVRENNAVKNNVVRRGRLYNFLFGSIARLPVSVFYLRPITVVFEVGAVFVIVAYQATVGCQPRRFDGFVGDMFAAGAVATFATDIDSVHRCFSVYESAVSAKPDCVTPLARRIDVRTAVSYTHLTLPTICSV